jgi:hypothetical protein
MVCKGENGGLLTTDGFSREGEMTANQRWFVEKRENNC